MAIANFISTSLHTRRATTKATEAAVAIVSFATTAILLAARTPIILMLVPHCNERTTRYMCNAFAPHNANAFQFTPLTGPAGGRRSRSSQAPRLRSFICLPRYGRQTIHESVLHWRSAMNKDQVKGTAEKVKGKVNETIGRATGDRKQEVKGDVQQAVGEARKKAGDVEEAVKDATTQKP